MRMESHRPMGIGGGAPKAGGLQPRLREAATPSARPSGSASRRRRACCSGSLRLPHFGDCTHDGQPASHGHSEISRSASPTSRSKRS